MASSADLIVVSQTPEEALLREWRQQGLERYVRIIAGQELGSKAEQLRLALAGKYDKDCVLMIGDALGDVECARQVGACFFPVRPGDEEDSWRLLNNEAFERFLAGEYCGAYEERLVGEFAKLLPAEPPWAEAVSR